MRQHQTQKYFLFSLAIIALMALVLRFWRIGQVPAGMTWDEAAIGYNGWAIATTHRDEWLKLMPISFKSFGDFKAPFAIYLNGVFTYLLGLKLWVVRLPFVLAGGLAVFGLGLLVRQWLLAFIKPSFWSLLKPINPEGLALLAAFSLAVSPWHFHFSRLGFESGLALAQIIWALYFFYKAINLKSNTHQASLAPTIYLLAGGTLLAVSVYTYHSTKLFSPLLVLMLLMIAWRWLELSLRQLSLFLGAFSLLLLPFFYDAFFGAGLTRAGVTLFSKVDGIINQVRLLGLNFFVHLSPRFLLLGQVDTLRHGGLPFSVLLPGSLLMSIVGLGLWLVGRFYLKPLKQLDWAYCFSLTLVVLGILPAAIGLVVPHANRALLALLGLILLLVLGWLTVAVWFELRQWSKHSLVYLFGFWLILQLGLFSYDLYDYYQHWQYQAADAFNDGYLAMAQAVRDYQLGINGKPEVKKIYVTSEYGQPYIYILFANQVSPIAYHQGALVKYFFPDVVNVEQLAEPNALVVAGQKADLIDKTKAAQVIYDSAGQPKFWLFLTKKKAD